MSLDRIDKILSHEGFGTRKDVRRILRASAVLINGNVVTDPGYHCDIDNDEISVDGQIISVQKNIYLMMNKPQNVVCANKDGLHDTVFSLLAEQYRTGFALENLHLIGRLDIDTEGLLIFTTDGKLTHKLISPKTNSPKTYFVRLESKIDDNLTRSNTYKIPTECPCCGAPAEVHCDKESKMLYCTNPDCSAKFTLETIVLL